MSTSKASKSGKGQKRLTSFFGGGSKTDRGTKKKVGKGTSTEDDSENDVYDDEPEVSEEDDTPVQSSKTDGKIESSSLPPLHDIPAMFADLVSRVPLLKGVAEHVQGRKLRVATMCSGTESPLLALEMICQSIKDQHGIALEFEHVFSCEIEPFKQAYIERNFKPPLLFRDVCELGDYEATTAYGALAPVPGDVDLLVAGTSCVDYSNLNNERKGIDGGGESGRTFHGMMSWVSNHRPPLVILENVCSAPWDRVKDYFKRQGYSADFLRVDTKLYYIPHTRTRVYLLAVDSRGSNIPMEWKNWIGTKLKRPASSTLDAFLLPSDDPRIHQARQKLVQDSGSVSESRAGRIDWTRCESRHARARLEEALGPKRPLTNWEEGGGCRMPDFAWQDWGIRQVERVWDLMDISLLRSAKVAVDPSYKTLVWNLSQNVDRSTGSSKPGICPCLTPSMIPYITNRGGPMVGVEALAMQGLPVDKLLLTRESQDELADLAGNAMSSTVVGACIIAALVVGRKLLKTGDDKETYEMKKLDAVEAETEESAMDVDSSQASDLRIEDHLSGRDQLVEKPLDLSATRTNAVEGVLNHAQRSVRLCHCEGRKEITTRELLRCRDCGSSSCKKCAGRPEHNFEPLDVQTVARLPPPTFVRELKSILPMCLSITSVTEQLLDQLRDSAGVSIPEKRWTGWRAAVLRATGSELRFVEPKRQEIWSAVYQSPTATLELYLDPKQTEWRLYAKPLASEPANAEIRRLLQLPVARLKCNDDFLQGRWQFAMPHVTELRITVTGSGQLVPSWEARLGLLEDKFKNKRVHSHLNISVPEHQKSLFDRDVSGTYALLDKCGTACGALHKRVEGADCESLPPLFMMLDPTRCGDAKDDSFVFTSTMRRYEYGEFRPVICKLAPSWRQSDAEGDQSVVCHIPVLWTDSNTVALEPRLLSHATFAVPRGSLSVAVSTDACAQAMALLSCNVPIPDDAGPEWPREEWREVDKLNERATFRALAWLLERIRHVDDNLKQWQLLTMPGELRHCQRCAPVSPTIKWKKDGKKVIAIEDSQEAGQYERDLKLRPSPFVTQLKLDKNIGRVRVGLNIASLLHRALSRLPAGNRTESPSLSWRLDTDFAPAVKISLPPYRLLSNKNDVEHAQPPHFGPLPLRPEQLRSLTWMLEREAVDAPPFVEEEISEATLEPLGWRAEGRAQRPVRMRGGVLADQVGYGKTAITLGLIDCAYNDVKEELEHKKDIYGKVPVKATLAIVPPHLTRQWASEAKRFAPKRFKKTVVVSTASQINSLTIEDVQQADLVIVASNLFQSNVYLANLEALAAAGTLPPQDGRYFNARLDICLEGLKEQVELLKTGSPANVMRAVRDARRKEEELEAQVFVAQKRLKGKQYKEAAEKEEKAKLKESKSLDYFPAKLTPSGQKPSVVINKLPPKTKRRIVDSENEDDEDNTTRPKRKSTAKAIVIDSDDDAAGEGGSDYEDTNDADDHDDDEQASDDDSDATKESKPSHSIAKPTPPPSSRSVTGDEETADSSSEDEKPKKKAVAKGKSVKRESNSSADDSMDVDDPPSAASASSRKKRKATDSSDKPTKKQKRREDTDPWHLESVAVRRNWTEMRSPPLEVFHFARVVVDEYTYLGGKVHSMVTKLTADRRWVLSGTPPIHDFGSVKTIAAHLNIHLGIDDDSEGQSAMIKKRIREQTKVEAFHSFREVHTQEWHAHRHRLGQVFLDMFVRQNIAEIDEIPCSFKVQKVILPAAERAIYLELEHHLRALDMTIKRAKKTESDREKRLNNALGESKTAEEALLKRCSHFDLDVKDKENAMKACEVIVQDRTEQLEECKAELLKELQKGVKQEKKIGKLAEESMFQEYARVSRLEGVGDQEATDMIRGLLDEAEVPALSPNHFTNKAKGKDDNISNSVKDLIWEHREHTHNIRKLTKELVGRVRSLRYFTVVRDLQKQRDTPPKVSCPGCKRNEVPMDEVAVLSSCGHMGCMTCVRRSADREECVYAVSGLCKAAARVLNIVKGETLGVDDEARDGNGRHYGRKLEMVIDLIKNQIPKAERVLIFVQFPDLMAKVANALKVHKIKFLEIHGSATQKSKNLEKYQNDSEERVLLLNLMDESASGANLTSANHAIFLSPLLAPTQEIYDACETQAVGRLRRYGQLQHVNIWRFLTLDTIDVEIHEQRTKEKIC
ncbi:hypothetical protein BKA82DRAFT_995209 [Pisolithus tinctorius]|uniref:Helicase ATP-binding domain-containing protein n=1 Tax=Pisolithus tinctorius Marx 270 TaxID=870435 RepID=A0A0C3JNH4_PISTI|nr:hypothetical protein BKA82DRAFT_995209 [Pisolithus tinctorius]KIO10738.1 hypothetical protein M404DRAFT_995209 [Pisolithus tinctorius Marx 270]